MVAASSPKPLAAILIEAQSPARRRGSALRRRLTGGVLEVKVDANIMRARARMFLKIWYNCSISEINEDQ